MHKIYVLVVIGLVILTTTYQCQFTEEARTQATYERYCGACHLTPDPSVLPKDLWAKQVLPEMGARLGIQVAGYDPFKGLSLEETFHIEQTGAYPKEPLISEVDWDRIYQFVLAMAPDSLPIDTGRQSRSSPLQRFQARNLSIDNLNGGLVTAIHYQEAQKNWWIGNSNGEWYQLDKDSSRLKNLFASALSGFDSFGDQQVIVEMGYMHPSDVPRGKLWRFEEGRRSVIAENLYRPVFVKSTDLDRDKDPEYLICEFGNKGGRLSLWQGGKAGYQQRNLINLPGTIRVEVADMNRDGLDDLVVLAGQGDEGIFICYQQSDGAFSIKHPVRLPPIYGSSWFELFDYDGDGDLDMAIVNGDNADYTYALKPYHGLRLFLNDGTDRFREAFFFPVYGATRLIARDFDQDEDIDFAVISVFPDFENNPEGSFIYLENEDPGSFQFKSYTTSAALEGNWLVMEAGDFEQDGDLDILLGSYTRSPAPVPDQFRRKWATQNVDLMLLENQTLSPAGVQPGLGDR